MFSSSDFNNAWMRKARYKTEFREEEAPCIIFLTFDEEWKRQGNSKKVYF